MQQLVAQLRDRGVVPVPEQRRRLVDQGVAAQHQAQEDVEVLTAGCACPTSERDVEPTDVAGHARAQRHVRAGPETAGGVREERVHGAAGVIEHDTAIALGKPAVLLQPELCRCLQLEREDETGHT